MGGALKERLFFNKNIYAGSALKIRQFNASSVKFGSEMTKLSIEEFK